MDAILKYLKNNGEQFDSDIATATGLSLANVQRHLVELAAKGEVITCHSIKYNKGTKIEGTSCRLAGYVPPAAPGRKPKTP